MDTDTRLGFAPCVTGAPNSPRAGAAMAVASMTSVQVGLAVSVSLLDRLGPGQVAVLRLGFAGLLLLLLVRPRRSQFTGRSFAASAVLGAVTAGVTILFMVAASRLPLGTAVALEFLGPLAVAVATATTTRGRVLWPALAALGVLLLTRPWEGAVDLLGVSAALGAACCWAAYILLTRQVGDAVSGLSGLAVSLTVAGVVATLVVGPGSWAAFTPTDLLAGVGLALLLPLLPFSLELLALRRLSTSAFGTLMCLEPGLALVAGLVLLGQVPAPVAVLGLALVVTAGVGAQRAAAPATVPETAPRRTAPGAAGSGTCEQSSAGSAVRP